MGSWITRAVPCAAAKDVGNLDSIEKREGKSQVFKVETGQSSLGFRPVNLLYSCLSREFRNNNVNDVVTFKEKSRVTDTTLRQSQSE